MRLVFNCQFGQNIGTSTLPKYLCRRLAFIFFYLLVTHSYNIGRWLVYLTANDTFILMVLCRLLILVFCDDATNLVNVYLTCVESRKNGWSIIKVHFETRSKMRQHLLIIGWLECRLTWRLFLILVDHFAHQHVEPIESLFGIVAWRLIVITKYLRPFYFQL